MTPIAQKLIHNLRHDSHTRKHFSISKWTGAGTCGTVGCIAGTVIYMLGQERGRLVEGDPFETAAAVFGWPDIVRAGQEALGIEFYETADHLFLPRRMAGKLLAPELQAFDYLPSQARPDLSTVAKMQTWARSYEAGSIGPDRAAFALERVVRDGVPYCNWAEAFEAA